jgi:phage-related protein
MRLVSWMGAARKVFEGFPVAVQEACLDALATAAAGGKHENAKPLRGLGSGILEIVLNDRSGT